MTWVAKHYKGHNSRLAHGLEVYDEESGAYLVVIVGFNLEGVIDPPASGAAISATDRAWNESSYQVAEGDTAKSVTCVDGSFTFAQCGEGELAVEGVAIVDIQTRERVISGRIAGDTAIFGIRTFQDPGSRIRVDDHHEVGNDSIGRVGSEIILVKLVLATIAPDVCSSLAGHDSSFQDALYNEHSMG